MEIRHKALSELQNFIKGVDQQVTMILQNLQWDRKCLLEDAPKVACSYDKTHKLSPNKKECHESWCFLKSHSYEKDLLLPDPLDVNASTLVKLDKQAITTIINNASCGNPTFRQGNRSHSPEPWTLERLQATYTADERRALHDAVVQAVPSCHDLADLALPSKEDGDRGQQTKSRNEILAELRDMKRRRAKYRVAAKTRKYSDVLRDVIKTQMELYTGAATQTAAKSDLVKSIQMKGETSIECMDKQLRSEYERRNRSRENSTESERVRASFGRGMEGWQPNDYCPTLYEKNKDRAPIGMRMSSASEKEKYKRKDYSYTSRYERKIDKNVSTERINVPLREGIKRQTQNYSSKSSYAKTDMQLSQEGTREKRKHNENSQKYRYGENHDNPSKKRRENENLKDYSYTEKSKRTRHNKSRSRRRESSGSSETNYKSPRRKERDSRERYYKSTRKRDRDNDTKISIKMERDETPGRDSTEQLQLSSYPYSSTYRSKRHAEYNSGSESDTTTRRRGHRKVKDDYYKTSHNRDRYTNVHIKIEKEDTPEKGIEREMRSDHGHTSKSHRKRDNRRSRSSEESYRPSRRSREREGRHSISYKSNYQNNNSADTGLRIKTERDSTPEEESSHIGSRYYPVHASTHSKPMRRDSNSSWE